MLAGRWVEYTPLALNSGKKKWYCEASCEKIWGLVAFKLAPCNDLGMSWEERRGMRSTWSLLTTGSPCADMRQHASIEEARRARSIKEKSGGRALRQIAACDYC